MSGVVVDGAGVWPTAEYEIGRTAAGGYRQTGVEDAAILSAHLEQDTLPDGALYVSVHCGPCPGGAQRVLRERGYAALENNYRRRIDLVVVGGGRLFVAEIKPSAGYVALGQALFYAYHVRRHHAAGRCVVPMIVTDRADPDVRGAMRAHGVWLRECSDAPFAPREYAT